MKPTILIAQEPNGRDDRADRARQLREAHSGSALVNIADICELLRLSQSWVYSRVQAGTFPAPVLRAPRFTRWRLRDVLDFAEQLGERAADAQTSALSMAKAQRASAAARAKRAAAEVAGE